MMINISLILINDRNTAHNNFVYIILCVRIIITIY